MKKGPEIFTEICDLVCASLSYSVISRRLRLSPSLVFKWMNECTRDKKLDAQNKVEIEFSKSLYVFEYGGIVGWFTDHIRTAMRASVLEIEATARNNCLGYDEQVFYQGRPTFQEDEKLIGVDDETLAILGLPDRYKRDRDGQRIPNVIRRPGSAQLIKTMLQAHGGKAFADKRSVDHTGALTVGVSVLSDRPPPRVAPPATPAARIAQHVAAEIAEPIIEDAEFVELEQTGEPEPAAVEPPMADADQAVTYTDDDGNEAPALPALDPMAASRAERAARLNAEAAAAVKHPRPGTPAPARPAQPSVRPPVPHATSAYRSEDERMEKLGAGEPPPGGVSLTTGKRS